MNTEVDNSKNSKTPTPNDRLREISEPKSDGDGSGLVGSSLAGFVLLKLNGYMKPPLAEELSDPSGAGTAGGCTCNSVCTCVPVQTCACDSVCTCDTVSTYTESGGGGGGGGGYGGYYTPCF